MNALIPQPVAYVLAAALVTGTVVVRLSMNSAIETSAFLLFLAAVMAAAWFGGTGPALLATALSALAGNFFFMEPKWAFGFGSVSERVEFVMFLIEGSLTATLAGLLHRARDTALAGQAEARALQAELLRVTDAEQRRIGHDLHDGLGQQLTGISFLATRLAQRLETATLPESDAARRLSDLSRAAVTWSHDLAQALIPPTLETDGLAPALRELAANVSNLFDVQCTFDKSDPNVGDFRDVSAGVHLYRIAQEAVTNAIKHGRADRVMIQLANNAAGGVVVSVMDAGPRAGSSARITPDDRADRSLGRSIMEYRARTIGGTLNVNRTPGGGTIVSCSTSGGEP